MKKRKQWIMLCCIALAVCLASGGDAVYPAEKQQQKVVLDLYSQNRRRNQ